MEKENINLQEGASKTFFDKIVDNELRQRARSKALSDRKEEIRLQQVEQCKNATKITAGIVFKGHGCIQHPPRGREKQAQAGRATSDRR